MIEISRIAKAHCNLFRLHDEQKWEEFRRNVIIYATSLGYDAKDSEIASHHVVKAYKNADLAVIAQQKGNKILEEKAYKNVLDEFNKAHEILGTEIKSPFYKVEWYFGARHRMHLTVLWNLFMEHFSKFGWRRIWLSIYTTYLTFAKAYPAHNSHNWRKLTDVLSVYWTAIKNEYPDVEKLPIEL
ncbi:MAG: hypothetical protein KGH59_00555 [Candidatus Micrarchaeota archaeon]|nr:hypothetical protein [Candidatus Micrarchaeota archaeon]